MSEPINALKVGEPFPTSKRFWDPVLQTVAAVRAGMNGQPRTGPADLANQWVKNTTEDDRKRYEVLGISGPLFDFATDARDVGDLAVLGDEPAVPDHLGRFVVLLEPCAAGKIAACKIDGVAKVWVEITDDNHRFADVLDGDATKLTSRDYGAAEILTRATGTGTRLCWVRLVGGVAKRTRSATLDEDLTGTGTASATLDGGRTISVKCFLLQSDGVLAEGTVCDVEPQPNADEWLVVAVDQCRTD